MFSKFERSASSAGIPAGPTPSPEPSPESSPEPTVPSTNRQAGLRERRARAETGNAAVVALCVTTLAVGVVMGVRLLSGSGSSNPVAPIAATNIGAGESDAEPGGADRTSSGPISSGAGTAVVAAPVPTLPGSVPTIPPDGAIPVAAAVPVVAVEVVEVVATTTPPIILGLKTPQAASRNLFDAWKENDRARARRFAAPAAVEVIFRQPWGAEVQDDGCSETSKPTSFHCAFVGDDTAWIVVVDQRIGPSGREFVPTRTLVTATKNSSGLSYAPPVPETVDPSATAPSPLSPTTTIDPLLLGDAPLADPAGAPDLSDPAIEDPSLLDPAGAAAALAADSGVSDGSDTSSGAGTGAGTGAGAGNGAGTVAGTGSGDKPSTRPTSKAPKKKKATVRRPKSAVSSSSKSASTDTGAAEVPVAPKPVKKVETQPAPPAAAAEPAAPVGAVKAGAPPVNEVDG